VVAGRPDICRTPGVETGSGRIDEWPAGSGSPRDLGISLQAPGDIHPTAKQLQRYAYPGSPGRALESITVPGGGYAGVAPSPLAPQGAAVPARTGQHRVNVTERLPATLLAT
jgi:hypothetical protein